MKPPYTIEELLLILESARMDDVSDRLRELWAEKEALAAPQTTGNIVMDSYKQMAAMKEAAPQGEPVAEVESDGVMRFKAVSHKYQIGDKLYLAPPAHPAPAPLSNEQIADIWVKTLKGTSGTYLPSVEFARAIERHVRGDK